MVLYQHILVAMPKFPVEGLVDMCKRLTKVVINAGGVVRSIENNGVRPLAERSKRYPWTFILSFLFLMFFFHFVGSFQVWMVNATSMMLDLLLSPMMSILKS